MAELRLQKDSKRQKKSLLYSVTMHMAVQAYTCKLSIHIVVYCLCTYTINFLLIYSYKH